MGTVVKITNKMHGYNYTYGKRYGTGQFKLGYTHTRELRI